VVLLAGSVGGYLLLFAIPFCRTFFKLDPSNVGATTSALIIGAVGIALVEVAHRFGSVLRNRQERT
jgi:cation-transporting ATPase E